LSFKKIIGQIHLWLGLISGLVVFIVSITGAIWCWESEVLDLAKPYRKLKTQEAHWQSPAYLFKQLPDSLQAYEMRRILYYGKDRFAEFSLKKGNEKEVYAAVNPYTGKLLDLHQGRKGFFPFILEMHVHLLMGEVGKQIVDYAVLIFVVSLITGIVLWWPKNRSATKQRFWLAWKPTTQWRRKNYDLHNVSGFYACWIVIFIAITGLTWGFQWVEKTIYYTATLGANYEGWPEPKSTPNPLYRHDPKMINDKIFYDALNRTKQSVEAFYLYPAADSVSASYAYTCPTWNVWWNSDTYYYDQYNGILLDEDEFVRMNTGRKLRNMYYDIHIGKILGLPGQLLAFFASLIAASLPVTGFMIWWGRRNKKNILHTVHETSVLHMPLEENKKQAVAMHRMSKSCADQ
jgi:uncharacterized iron-regulated membrane protein